MYPTSNIFYRVFNLRVTDGFTVSSGGTMFAVDVDDRQYFVTARHIGKHIGSSGIQVMSENQWVPHPATVVGHGKGKVDVTVITSPDPLIPGENRFPLPLGSAGIKIGEEMMFLGFPAVYDPSMGFSMHHGFPLPLTKYARLSNLPQREQPMWLDGHNNRGFSGAPLCFAPSGNNDLVVAGVVCAYKPSTEEVVSGNGEPAGLYVQENTGFILAWDIRHCVEIIHSNPIGFELIG